MVETAQGKFLAVSIASTKRKNKKSMDNWNCSVSSNDVCSALLLMRNTNVIMISLFFSHWRKHRAYQQERGIQRGCIERMFKPSSEREADKNEKQS